MTAPGQTLSYRPIWPRSHANLPGDMKRAVAETLVTHRLELRPLELSDSPAIQAVFPQWDIVRYLAPRVPCPYPSDGALVFVRDVTLPAVARGEEWAWTIRRRQEPERLIGALSLMTQKDNNRGFWLTPRWQGHGFMTEACEATLSFWFEVLGFDRLRVPKAAANAASRAISQREGMRLIWTGEREFVSGRLPAEMWEITAQEWRAAQA